MPLTFAPTESGSRDNIRSILGRRAEPPISAAAASAYTPATRQYLYDQLAHSENLTGPQLLDVIGRLKDIAVRMEQFQRAGASSATCSGAVSTEADGSVLVTTTEDGRILIECK